MIQLIRDILKDALKKKASMKKILMKLTGSLLIIQVNSRILIVPSSV